jgi:hypothetical protein
MVCVLNHTGQSSVSFCNCECHNANSLNVPTAAHRQEVFCCQVCGRSLIVDLFSIGSEHQTIRAVTCYDCARKANGNILGNQVDIFNIGT